MKTYQPIQRGTLIIVVILALTLILTVIGCFTDWHLFWVVPVLLLAAWLFHSLTIEIAGGELRWRFLARA